MSKQLFASGHEVKADSVVRSADKAREGEGIALHCGLVMSHHACDRFMQFLDRIVECCLSWRAALEMAFKVGTLR